MKYLILLLALLPINVNADSGANASWTVPTFREDGSALDEKEIGEYRVYYGTSAGDYTETVEVVRKGPNIATPTEVSLSLATGKTYYLVITAVDLEGRESLFSDEIVLPVEHYRIKKIEGVTVVEVRVTIN